MFICLNDQAYQSLIHFYKRCVSLMIRPESPGLMLSVGLYESPFKKSHYLINPDLTTG